jgi:hypothetical protein
MGLFQRLNLKFVTLILYVLLLEGGWFIILMSSPCEAPSGSMNVGNFLSAFKKGGSEGPPKLVESVPVSSRPIPGGPSYPPFPKAETGFNGVNLRRTGATHRDILEHHNVAGRCSLKSDGPHVESAWFQASSA